MAVISSSWQFFSFYWQLLCLFFHFSQTRAEESMYSCSPEAVSLLTTHSLSPGWEMPMTGQLVCKNVLFIHTHFFRKPLCVNMHIPQLGTEIQVPSVIFGSQCQESLCPVAFWENYTVPRLWELVAFHNQKYLAVGLAYVSALLLNVVCDHIWYQALRATGCSWCSGQIPS